MMDVQLVNDVRHSFFSSVSPADLYLTLPRQQGPVTIILDSKVDAPPPPAPKQVLSPELKKKRKDDLAAKAKAREERDASLKLAQEEEESKKLADRFKEAMSEGY